MQKKYLNRNLSHVTSHGLDLVKLQSVADKLGNIYHRVVFVDDLGKSFGYIFTKLSSALDFITSNFR